MTCERREVHVHFFPFNLHRFDFDKLLKKNVPKFKGFQMWDGVKRLRKFKVNNVPIP